MKTKAILSTLACLTFASILHAAGERLQIGEFTATKFDKPPIIDGKIEPGEWDRAFTTSGLIAPFDQQLQESETTMSMGFNKDNLYFLFRCRRGNNEWKLWKKARAFDEWDFGDPSVEIWVTPPAMVDETYQNAINTFPAILSVKNIPSRGYSSMGWKADWKVATSEDENYYTIEASVPIKDFGFDTINSGDVWRFLLCRTCIGGMPRPQASWSLTEGFAEIPQHPKVHFLDDQVVAQLTGVSTILTGKYAFQAGVVGLREKASEADVELRFQKGITPASDDRVETKHLTLAANDRQVVNLSGDVTDWTPAGKNGKKSAFFSVTVTKADGTQVFRQSFPYTISGWTPQTPVKPENAPPLEELSLSAQYGPETNTVLVKADIFDLPGREQVASAEAKVVEPETGKVLGSVPMRSFRQYYGGVELHLKDVEIPTNDFRKVATQRAAAKEVMDRNTVHKNKHEPVEPLPDVPQTPAKKVNVVVTLKDKDGKELKSATKELDLVRYAAEWMNNDVGVTDNVIPPWTPVQVKGPDVSIWNRTLSLDGLGMATKISNGGVSQLAAPMRLVAVKDGREIEIKTTGPELGRHVEAEADFNGNAEAAGLKFTARTHVEFDGFVNVNLDIAPSGKEAAKVDGLYLEIVLPAEEATHYCTTAGGWTAVHDVLPDKWNSESTASGLLVNEFVPYIWLTNSDRAFLWFADHDKGWSHAPGKTLPTQEIRRENGKVYLRINFFAMPTEVKESRTITWGWQTFPSRPLPAGWRATYCAGNPPVAHTKNTYFWINADWAVLWPYYCSPFPWHFDRSKVFLDAAKKSPLSRPSVGSIAHSIGRYLDYDLNPFPGLSVDWGATPGTIGNSDVTASKGPNDFRLWHYQRWVRESGFCGLYVDENYLPLEDNFLTGNAYWLPDGQLQRGYNYLGLREYFKRLKVMFKQNNVPTPNLWQHITSGAAYHAWFGDIFFEGENVEPTDLNYDYIEVLPAGRMRAIGSSVCAGGVMTMMCQSERHRSKWYEKHSHQFVGWVMAHDIIPETDNGPYMPGKDRVPLYAYIAEAAHFWANDVRFLPYWKKGPFTTAQQDCLVSAHIADGRALLWIVNKSRQDANVKVSVDWKAIGMSLDQVTACNVETGEPVPLAADGLAVPVLQRDFVPILLLPHGQTLISSGNGVKAAGLATVVPVTVAGSINLATH